MLERFSKVELQMQKTQLEEMLQCCLEKAKQIREITKPSKKQRKEKKRKEESQERREEQEEQQSSSFPPSYEYSQNRRRTLRRQIEKIEMILCHRTEERVTEAPARIELCSTETIQPVETEKSEQLEQKDELAGQDSIQEKNSVNTVNPKVRYGWGFWRD
jgi:hypothetical protein